jgi:hypothetical protein
MIESYKTSLKTIIEEIEFETNPLKDIIVTYQKSRIDTPMTRIHIYRSRLSIENVESQMKHKRHTIYTEVITHMQGRELKAQQDMDYLIEAIMEKYVDNLSKVDWVNGYLDSENFSSSPIMYSKGYFVQYISVDIVERYMINSNIPN